MYNTSKYSSKKSSCNTGIVSSQKYFQLRRDKFEETVASVEEEQFVDTTCHPVGAGGVTVSELVSVSLPDTAGVNSDMQLLTSASPDCHSGLFLEKFADKESDKTDNGVEADMFDGGIAEQDTLLVVHSAADITCTAPVEAVNGDSSSIVASAVDSGSVPCGDDIAQSDVAVLQELTSEEKVGFEADAITAGDQWQPRMVERRVKHLQTEVRRLLFDVNGSGMKRVLRASGHVLGGVRRKTRRSPLQRLRTTVSLRQSNSTQHCRTSTGKVYSKGN